MTCFTREEFVASINEHRRDDEKRSKNRQNRRNNAKHVNDVLKEGIEFRFKINHQESKQKKKSTTKIRREPKKIHKAFKSEKNRRQAMRQCAHEQLNIPIDDQLNHDHAMALILPQENSF